MLSDVVNQEVSIPLYDNVANNWNGLPNNSKETRTIQNAIRSSKILLKHWIGEFQFDMFTFGINKAEKCNILNKIDIRFKCLPTDLYFFVQNNILLKMDLKDKDGKIC